MKILNYKAEARGFYILLDAERTAIKLLRKERMKPDSSNPDAVEHLPCKAVQ